MIVMYVRAEVIGIASVDESGTPLLTYATQPVVNQDGSYIAFASEGAVFVYNKEKKITQKIDAVDQIVNSISITPNTTYLTYVKWWNIAIFDLVKNEFIGNVGELAAAKAAEQNYYASQWCNWGWSYTQPMVTDAGVVSFSLDSTCVFTYDIKNDVLTYIDNGSNPAIDQLYWQYIVYQSLVDNTMINIQDNKQNIVSIPGTNPRVANGLVVYEKDWNVKYFDILKEKESTLTVGNNQNISADGKYIVFTTNENLDSQDDKDRTNSDVYVYEIATDTYRLVSIKEGKQADSQIWDKATIAISADGSYIAMHGHDSSWFTQEWNEAHVFYATNPFTTKDEPNVPSLTTPSEQQILYQHTVDFVGTGTPWSRIIVCADNKCFDKIEITKEWEWSYTQDLAYGPYTYSFCYQNIYDTYNDCPKKDETLTLTRSFTVAAVPYILSPAQWEIFENIAKLNVVWTITEDAITNLSVFDENHTLICNVDPEKDGSRSCDMEKVEYGIHTLTVCTTESVKKYYSEYKIEKCYDDNMLASSVTFTNNKPVDAKPLAKPIIITPQNNMLFTSNIVVVSWTGSAWNIVVLCTVDTCFDKIEVTKEWTWTLKYDLAVGKYEYYACYQEFLDGKTWLCTNDKALMSSVMFSISKDTKPDTNTGSTSTGVVSNIVQWYAAWWSSSVATHSTPTAITIVPTVVTPVKEQDSTTISAPITTPPSTQTPGVGWVPSPSNDTSNVVATPIVFETAQIINPTMQAKTCVEYDQDFVLYDQWINTSPAYKEALYFARLFDLTKYDGTTIYRPSDYITREEAAKLFSQFAVKVLCRKSHLVYDTSVFVDLDSADQTLLPYIKESYELGIFKGAEGKFRPTDLLTKEETVAILMRLLTNEMQVENGETWAKPYQQVAFEAWLWKDTTALQWVFTRSYIVQKLYAAYKQVPFTLKDAGYVMQQNK